MSLTDRARRICSEDTIEAELRRISEILESNGYPQPFILRNMVPRRERVLVPTVEKKSLFICLPFKRDQACDYVNHRLCMALHHTFPAARLKAWFITSPMLRVSLKDKLPVHSQNMVVYSFLCCCASEYVGRTTRQLSKRIKEHHPAWLRSNSQKSITSAVVVPLVDSGHAVSPLESFEVIIYRAPCNLPEVDSSQPYLNG